MPGPKPTQSIDAAAMTRINTIKIMTRFITTHLLFLDTAMTIKSYPSSSSGRRLPIPPAKSTAPRTSPQTVQKVTVTAGVAGITPKSITPTTKDTGKDSGQKLMDVLYRSAAGPCNPFWTKQRVVHGPRTAHPTDIMGAGVFTKPLA